MSPELHGTRTGPTSYAGITPGPEQERIPGLPLEITDKYLWDG